MKLLIGALGLILIYLAASGKLNSVTQALILPGGMPKSGGTVGSVPNVTTKQTEPTTQMVNRRR